MLKLHEGNLRIVAVVLSLASIVGFSSRVSGQEALFSEEESGAYADGDVAEVESLEEAAAESGSDPYFVEEPASLREDPPYGFYPTGEEVELLGGESRDMYHRGIGGINGLGPDAGSLTASGIWHQDQPEETFYDRYDGFFDPLDTGLGFFAPRELALFEGSDEPSNSNFSAFVDPGFPLTRDFNPDLATFKMGPLYMDLVSLSGTILYSDYTGYGPAAETDGWLSAVQLNFRGLVQITENLYLSGSGQVYYLPDENEFGFYFGDGNGSFLRLAYETYFRGWEVTIFDEFRAVHRLSEIFDEIEVDEIAIAGRYRFGRYDDFQDTDYFDTDSIFFINRAGVEVNKDLTDLARISLGYVHNDYWNTLDFEEHRNWDQFYARLDYSGQDWRIAPYLEYRLTAVDSYDTLFHTVYLGATAAITENLRFAGRAGYLHTGGTVSDGDRILGDLALTHQLSESTSHSLSGGVTHSIWYDAQNWLATYGRYTIRQQFGSRLSGTAYTQYSDAESLDDDGRTHEGWLNGVSLTAFVCEYTSLRLDVTYDQWTSGLDGRPDIDIDRWIYRASLNQRLLPYLYARLLYQYEDYNRNDSLGFDENLYMLTITHLF